jgi:hypothetical protein
LPLEIRETDQPFGEVGFVLEVSLTACRHKIVILMVVNGGKMRMKGE